MSYPSAILLLFLNQKSVKVSIHSLFDGHLFIILPSLPVLENIYQYLLLVSANRAKKAQDHNLWKALRKGELKDLESFVSSLFIFPT